MYPSSVIPASLARSLTASYTCSFVNVLFLSVFNLRRLLKLLYGCLDFGNQSVFFRNQLVGYTLQILNRVDFAVDEKIVQRVQCADLQ